MKKLKVLIGILCVWAMMAFLLAPNVQALLWTAEKDWTLYGNLDQDNVDPIWGNVACGPTAAVNSFVYLQNKYPKIYDEKLVPDVNNDDTYSQEEMAAVAQILGGADYMNTIADSGTYSDRFIYGKSEYIESIIPNMTIYHAQSYYGWTHLPPDTKPDWFEQKSPTWEFIYQELKKCEDVEIRLSGGAEHYLTLYSFSWDDSNGTGQMGYIDPDDGMPYLSNIWFDNGNNWLETTYAGGSIIRTAVSESPVPEPATIILFVIGILGLGAYGFRRKKKG